MTDEEILRKKLDRLNENSYYGIMTDTEITKIVRRHIKRLEEIKMNDIKPLVVVFDDKFNGMYSGGKWTAWNMCYVPSKIFGDEKECADFFAKENLIFGRGETPEEAIEDLKHMRYYGSHMTREHIKAVSESTEDEEDEKMEPTSVWKIEDIDNICINQDIDGVTLMLKNRDDLTKIMLSGEAIDNYNELFVTSLKKDEDIKDQEIKRKNREINELNQKLHQAIKDKERLTDRYKDLEKQYNEFSDEVALIHGVKYTVEGLVDRILELEKLKTPTIENFADEEPSSRRDILKAAEKCVCGQREQDYGTPESNFQLIADLWNDYLKKEQSSVVVDAMDVSMMMALLKIARIKNGGGSGDSFVDLAGYAACGGEIWHLQKKTNGDSSQETN